MLHVVLLITMLSAQAQEAARNPRTSPVDIVAGAKTFRQHCSVCHGLNGEGGRGPNLASGQFYHGSSDLDLLNTISDGIPGTEMPSLFYSPDRIWQIIAYIRSLNSARTAPTGDPVRGAEVFSSKGCPQCHRVNGQGGRLGPELTYIAQIRSLAHLRQSVIDPNADVRPPYWVVTSTDSAGTKYEGFVMNEDTYTIQFLDMQEHLRSFSKAELKDYRVEQVSKMPSYKDALTDKQLEDLVAYLGSLRWPRVSP
jgi:putative heme-binding domain-containing protein